MVWGKTIVWTREVDGYNIKQWAIPIYRRFIELVRMLSAALVAAMSGNVRAAGRRPRHFTSESTHGRGILSGVTAFLAVKWVWGTKMQNFVLRWSQVLHAIGKVPLGRHDLESLRRCEPKALRWGFECYERDMVRSWMRTRRIRQRSPRATRFRIRC